MYQGGVITRDQGRLEGILGGVRSGVSKLGLSKLKESVEVRLWHREGVLQRDVEGVALAQRSPRIWDCRMVTRDGPRQVRPSVAAPVPGAGGVAPAPGGRVRLGDAEAPA